MDLLGLAGFSPSLYASFMKVVRGCIPVHPIGKGMNRTWRASKRASSLRSRSNRRKARRYHR